MREAPSLTLIKELLQNGVKVTAYDPVALNEAKRILKDSIEYSDDQYEALVDTDALVVVTEWNEFKVLRFKVIAKLLKNKVIFDGRNIYDAEEMEENGFSYYCIGK